jgi:hypothetical protein
MRRVDLEVAPSLDKAWRLAETARPGWQLQGVMREGAAWVAWAMAGKERQQGRGQTPIDALTDLARALRDQ